MLDSWWVLGGVAMLTALGALAASSLHVVWADQRLVVFRFGELTAVKGPGLAFVLPGVGRGVRVPLADTFLDRLWPEVTSQRIRRFAGLSHTSSADLRALSAAATARARAWGVAVTLVEISRMQLSLDPQLIRWAERFSGRPGDGRTT